MDNKIHQQQWTGDERIQHKILRVPVEAQTFEAAISTLDNWLHHTEKRYVSTCTVSTITQAQNNPLVLDALNQADIVTADGMPLVWLQRAAGFDFAERVYGPDLLWALCERTQHENIRHYFLGGDPGVAEKLVRVLQAHYPALEIAGWLSPVVPNNPRLIASEIVAAINQATPGIVWVGLGSPKQDVWMYSYRPFLDAPLMIGVGAAFDFIAGTKPQAPLWMRHAGLEWLFRLLTEPRRLWKRYLVYNTLFLYYLLRHWAKRVLRRRRPSG